MLFGQKHYFVCRKRAAGLHERGADPHKSAPRLLQRYCFFRPKARSVKIAARPPSGTGTTLFPLTAHPPGCAMPLTSIPAWRLPPVGLCRVNITRPRCGRHRPKTGHESGGAGGRDMSSGRACNRNAKPSAEKTAERSAHVNPGLDDRREATPGDFTTPKRSTPEGVP